MSTPLSSCRLAFAFTLFGAVVASAEVPVITLHPHFWRAYAGQNISNSVSLEHYTGATYQWFKDNESLPGQTNRSLSLSAVTPGDSGSYHVVVTNADGTATSHTAAGIVLEADTVEIITQPTGRQVDYGDTFSLRGGAAGGALLYYTWYRNGELIRDASRVTDLYLRIDDESDLGTYHFEVTNGTATATSAPAEIRLAPARPPYFSTHPPAQIKLRVGESFAGVVGMVEANRPGTTAIIKDGVAQEGPIWEHNLAYRAITADDAGVYQIQFTNEAGTALSGTCRVEVIDDAAPVPPLILSTSPSQTVSSTGSFTLQVNTPPYPQRTFQWFHEGQLLAGATQAELHVPDFDRSQLGHYTVRVSTPWATETSAPIRVDLAAAGEIPYFIEDSIASSTIAINNADLGAQGEKPISYQWLLNGEPISRTNLRRRERNDSDVITLLATNRWGSTESPPVSYSTAILPVIISREANDLSLPAGTNSASLQIYLLHRNYTDATYQWFKDGEPIANADSERLYLTALHGIDAGTYHVELTHGGGVTVGRPTTLEIRNVPGQPIFTAHPQRRQLVAAGESATFTAAASPNGSPVSYQWYHQGSPIAGETTTSLTIPSVGFAQRGVYWVDAISDTGTVHSKPAVLEIGIDLQIEITREPEDQSAPVGGTVTFTVEATSPFPLSYRWLDGLGVTVGADSPTLTLTDVGLGNSPAYSVIVSNELGGIRTRAAELIVETDRDYFFSLVPQPITAAAGTTATFTAKFEGRSPFYTLQWYRDGVPIPGANSETLILENVTSADAGDYHFAAQIMSTTLRTNPAPLIILPAGQTLRFTQHAIGHAFTPGEPVTILNTVAYVGELSALTWDTLLPAGTTLAARETAGAEATAIGATDLAQWTWTQVPPSPFSFTTTLDTSTELSSWLEFTSMVSLITTETASTDTLATPDPLIIRQRRAQHSADTDGDGQIDLSELLGLIELYNTRTGSQRTGRYAIDAQDRFLAAPEATARPHRLHSSDTSGDGRIDLSELLRVIELYNTRSGTTRTGAYHPDATTADGFAPGAGE